MKLFKSAFLVSFFTTISRFLGFIRDVLIAKEAGASNVSDIFFAAFRITNFFRRILSEGSFFAALVPSFQKIYTHKGLPAAQDFSSKIFSIMLYIGAMLTILAEIFMDKIIFFTSPGFMENTSKFQTTVHISRILFFYFLMVLLVSVMSGILNSVKKFSYYAIFPIFLNISMITCVSLFKDHFDNFLYCLVTGVLIGGVLQFIFVYTGCIIENVQPKIFLAPSSIMSVEVKETCLKFFPAMISMGMSQVNTLIEMILGSTIPQGVSHLYYGDRLFFMPASVIGTALSIVVLPALSLAITQKNTSHTKEIQNQAFTIASIFAFMASGVMITCPEVITSIAFERGKFTKIDTQAVATLLHIMGISIPLVVYNKLLSSIFFSNGDTKSPMYINLISIIFNVIMAFALVEIYGLPGITAASCISYLISFVGHYVLLTQKTLIELSKGFLIDIIKIATSAACGVACIIYLFKINTYTSYYENFYHKILLFKFLYLTSVFLCGFLVLYGFLLLFRFDASSIFKNTQPS